MNKKVIGVYHSEEEVVQEIEKLERDGYASCDIYAVAKDADDISLVRGRTDIDVRTTETDWLDRFVGFITGEEPVRDALFDIGLSHDEINQYYDDINNGGILVYVDETGSAATTQTQDPMMTNSELGHTSMTNTLDMTHAEAELNEGDGSRDANLGPAPVADSEDMKNIAALDNSSLDMSPTDAGWNQQNEMRSDLSEPPSMNGHMTDDEEARLKLHEEKLNVDKKEVETGEVTVNKYVVEEEQSVDVPVSKEEIYVERRPVDEKMDMNDASPIFNEEGEEIRIPLKEEQVDVSKETVVNEELVVGKREVENTETVRETVRREEADVDELNDMNKQKYNVDMSDSDWDEREDRDHL